MVKELDKFYGKGILSTYENTAKAVSDEDAFPDYILDNTPKGSDFL